MGLGGRPYGQLFHAIRAAVAQQPLSTRQIAMRQQIAYNAARYTVSRMAQAGALVRVGSSWPARYAPAPVQEQTRTARRASWIVTMG